MDHFLKNRSAIPSAAVLQARLQSLAMLDAILEPEWEWRFFSFNSHWAKNEMMASMRDGQGSEFFFLFHPAGVAGKVFCPDKRCDPDSILARMPATFGSFRSEPAFSLRDVTCCLWQRRGEESWSMAPAKMEEIPWLAFVGDAGEHYRAFAECYHERPILAAGVFAIFAHRPLTKELLSSLNPETTPQGISPAIEEIGYPAQL